MHKPLRLGLRVGMGLGLSFAVGTGGCSLGQNFNQCQVDSDCPSTNAAGQKLYCTQDNLCSVGTPASKLCGEVYPANSPANAIVIGVLTNIQQGSDALPVLAFEQAIDEMNALRVSTGDRQFSLHLCEISATPEDPLKSMKILAREHGAVAVLGPSSSSYVLAIAPEVIASQVPIMSQSASSPAISDLPSPGLFFRTVPQDNLQGPVLAAQLPPGAGKFDMIIVNDTYGTGLQQAFFKSTSKLPAVSVNYAELGGTTASLTAGVQTAANQILADSPAPNYVVAITNNFTTQVVQALQSLSLTSKIVMADGAKNQTLLNLSVTGSAATKMHLARITGTAPTVDLNNTTGTGAYNQLLTTYQQKWKQSAAVNNYISYAYDAAYAVGIAIAAAGNNVTPQTVSQMLLRINGSTDRITVGATGYLMAKNKLASSGNIMLQGATGNIRFTSHGDRDSGLYEVWSIDTTTNVFKQVAAN